MEVYSRRLDTDKNEDVVRKSDAQAALEEIQQANEIANNTITTMAQQIVALNAENDKFRYEHNEIVIENSQQADQIAALKAEVEIIAEVVVLKSNMAEALTAENERLMTQIVSLTTLINGASDIVETWDAGASKYQAEWKRVWLRDAQSVLTEGKEGKE